jgi:hypothetical protein
MHTAENVPRNFWVRAGAKKNCDIWIDELAGATNAMLFHRTWNGEDGGAGSGTVQLPLYVNSWRGKVGGVSHNYALSRVDIPLNSLVAGLNQVAYTSNTSHHGIEILWPGPAILVRHNMHASRVETPLIDPLPGEYAMPLEVSITCETPGAEIHYTTAGSDPDVGSRKYATAITLRDSAIVKAMATKFDFLPSHITRHSYSKYQSPFLEDAYKGESPNTIEVVFNKPVERESAETVTNYSLNKEGIIVAAKQVPDHPANVVLTVDGMVEGTEYELSVTGVTDETGTPVPENSSVTFLYKYIIEVTSSSHADEHPSSHAMDGNLNTYWSANGTSGVWIQIDLRTIRQVQSVHMAFYLGDQRKNFFAIMTSSDEENWTEVFHGESNGTTLKMQEFDFEDIAARYVRIEGLGNSTGNGWNSYTEIRVNLQGETGIEYEQSGTGFTVFPVPAVHGIYIRFPLWKEETAVYFTNARGQSYETRLTGRSTWIPTERFASGLYVVTIPQPQGILRKKIMITRMP